jgi:hypothetical protein
VVEAGRRGKMEMRSAATAELEVWNVALPAPRKRNPEAMASAMWEP